MPQTLTNQHNITLPKNQVVFVSLGGAGEIGMNMYLYGYRGKWLIIDCGITFDNELLSTTDIVLPDSRFIEEKSTDLVGLVITHGHEDHLGAIPWLWPKLRCPVYGTSFSIRLLRSKLADFGLERVTPLHSLVLGEQLVLEPFTIECVTLTHSIPESVAVTIRTPVGTILHSGDWKFDPSPLVGKPADINTLIHLGEEGIMAMVSDSTNAFTVDFAGSETDVRSSLTSLFADVSGCIIVTCFASNIARLESIAVAAVANGRQVAVAGRSLWRVVDVAKHSGYLQNVHLHTDQAVAKLPREKVLYVCTGSQGESRSVLTRVAGCSHPHIRLGQGDMVVFSSRVIPGNERAIRRLYNGIVRLGARIVTKRDYFVHVSGHSSQAEMIKMYKLVRPRFLIPVHGEICHLVAHAELARNCGASTVVIQNGQMISLGPNKPRFLGIVPVGRMVVDGRRIIPQNSQVLRSRKQMMFSGLALLTLVVDKNGSFLRTPQLTIPGLVDAKDGNEITTVIIAEIQQAINQLVPVDRCDDNLVKAAARLAIRRSCKANFGKKPLTEIHLVRL